MTVFVVQENMRRDTRTGELKPVYDIRPALAFGNLEYLLGPGAVPFGDENNRQLVEQLYAKLGAYDPDKDYILPMGNPVLIGWAIAIAADCGDGTVQALVWNSRDRMYSVSRAEIYTCGP